MPRNKHPEVTATRILDTSLKLFVEKGYEQTTIQDIVDALGDLSKGAIYHHFKSKEEIIDAISSRDYGQYSPFDFVAQDKDLNGLEKLRNLFRRAITHEPQLQLLSIATTCNLMENPKFLAEQLKCTIHIAAPQLSKLIEEAIGDGSVSTAYPLEAAETILLLINIWINPAIFPVEKEAFIRKILFLKKVLEDLNIPIFDEETLREMESFYDAIQPTAPPQ